MPEFGLIVHMKNKNRLNYMHFRAKMNRGDSAPAGRTSATHLIQIRGKKMARKLEDLPPLSQQISELLSRRTADLLNLITIKEHAIKNAPAGSVRIVQRRNKVLQFYKKTTPGDYQGTYMSREEDGLARSLVQKDYDQRALEKAKDELRLIQSFQTTLQKKSTDTAFAALDETRKTLVTPATLTDAQYAERWQKQPYRKTKKYEENQKLTTDNGELVRSKSEVIIANLLKCNNVPYRYEFPLVIARIDDGEVDDGSEDYCEFHPDFYCLNVRTRQEYAWEHFGKMDDEEYAKRAIEKLSLYSANGYFPGKNLIITMESKNSQIQSHEISRVIKEYLK